MSSPALCACAGGRKNPRAEHVSIDTSNILFICGGAFSGLQRLVSERKQDVKIGFDAVLKESSAAAAAEKADSALGTAALQVDRRQPRHALLSASMHLLPHLPDDSPLMRTRP